ncbi:MAG: hypothetical protein ABII00_00690 [Elusimicrobiota bacterium]
MTPCRPRGERGAALLAVLLLFSLMLLISLPLMSSLLRQNAHMVVKNKHRKIAYQLASAGVERAIWKLKETGDNWRTILSAGPLAGYDNDVEYTDVSAGAGSYRVSISSTADEDLFVILSAGKDRENHEFVAVETRVRRAQIMGALHAYDIDSSSGITGIRVHWGPIVDHGSMNLTHHLLNQLYPRKYAAGTITISSGVYPTRDESPNTPNNDGSEYWAYYDVPPLLVPDFDLYRSSAQAMGEYYSGNKTFNSLVDGSPKVRFIEGDVTFQKANKFVWGTVIVMGDCTLKGRNTAGPGDYPASPPYGAWLEYQKNVPVRYDQTGLLAYGDTGAANEYPGDAGLASTTTWTFGTAMSGVNGQRVSFRGVLYCAGNFIGAVNPAYAQVIHGALIVNRGSQIQGNVEIFYDESVRLVTSMAGVYTDEWRLVQAAPF